MRGFLCLFTFVVLNVSAQSGPQRPLTPVSVLGGSLDGKEMIFIAETHTIAEKAGFYSAFLYQMANQYNVCNVVLECSHANAYLLNRYLSYGDTTVLVYNQDTGRRQRILDMKRIYDLLPPDKKFRIYGIDFERMDYVIAARKILEQNKVYGTPLNRFLDRIPDSMLRKVYMTPTESKLRIAMYDSAQSVFAGEQSQLKTLLSTDYDVLERIFHNPSQEARFARRDLGMYQNLKDQLAGKPFVCIVGLYHVTYTRHQFYPSLIKLVIKKRFGIKDRLTIINEVGNRKYLANRLWDKEGTPPQYTDGKAGPGYFTRSDSAMYRGFHNYFSGGDYVLAHKSLFGDLVPKGNHGLDEYYIFLGDGPAK